MIQIEICRSCGQWFTPVENDGHVIVKVRGAKPRYYCGYCIKQNQISNKGDLQNEHK